MSDEERTVCAAAMNNLGYLHFYHNNDPVVSYSYLVRGMSVAEELGTKKLIANLSLNMANVFCTLDEYDSAIACYRRAIVTGLESGQYEAVLTSLSNIISLTCSQPLPPKISRIAPETARVHLEKFPELPTAVCLRVPRLGNGVILIGRSGASLLRCHKSRQS